MERIKNAVEFQCCVIGSFQSPDTQKAVADSTVSIGLTISDVTRKENKWHRPPLVETHHPYRPDLCQTAQPLWHPNSPQWKVEYLIIYNLILSSDKEEPCYFRRLMVYSTHHVCGIVDDIKSDYFARSGSQHFFVSAMQRYLLNYPGCIWLPAY